MSDQHTIIDSRQFTREKQLLTGQLPLRGFDRLQLSLSTVDSERDERLIDYRLTGCIDNERKALLTLHIEGQLPLCCQRCLEPLIFMLQVDRVFELVTSEDAITQKEIDDDSRDYLVAERKMDILALIEDEIILSLPLVPMHENCRLPSLDEVGAMNH